MDDGLIQPSHLLLELLDFVLGLLFLLLLLLELVLKSQNALLLLLNAPLQCIQSLKTNVRNGLKKIG